MISCKGNDTLQKKVDYIIYHSVYKAVIYLTLKTNTIWGMTIGKVCEKFHNDIINYCITTVVFPCRQI